MVDLSKRTLLARGGQAEIYEYGDGKVLRVLRGPQDRELLKNEIEVMKALRGRVHIPAVYAYMEIDGRPAAIVERIKGHSLVEEMRRHPLSIGEVTRTLARLHLKIGEARIACALPSERSNVLVGQSPLLDDELKDFVCGLIDGLPRGDDLCHGDFHPGNILRHEGRDYIIDWFGAYRGDILSDVAHSYLLMRNVPRMPDIGVTWHRIMWLAGKMMSGRYIGAVHNLHPFDWGVFSQWLVIKAAERTVYGLPGEKERLAAFVRACYELRKRKVPPDRWYKKL
jgi:serine/threonine protein kinase